MTSNKQQFTFINSNSCCCCYGQSPCCIRQIASTSVNKETMAPDAQLAFRRNFPQKLVFNNVLAKMCGVKEWTSGGIVPGGYPDVVYSTWFHKNTHVHTNCPQWNSIL